MSPYAEMREAALLEKFANKSTSDVMQWMSENRMRTVLGEQELPATAVVNVSCECRVFCQIPNSFPGGKLQLRQMKSRIVYCVHGLVFLV